MKKASLNSLLARGLADRGSRKDLGDGHAEVFGDELQRPHRRALLAHEPLARRCPVLADRRGELSGRDIASPARGMDSLPDRDRVHAHTVTTSHRDGASKMEKKSHVAENTMCAMKPYPPERKRPLSDEWKQRVRDRLAEMGRDHRWLEAQIGASRGMVTKMLRPSQNTSALVDRVCEALEIAPPMSEVRSEDEQELVTLYRSMSPEQRRQILGLLKLGREPN